MTIHILTLFPEYFTEIFHSSILKRGQEKQLFSVNVVNIRDFATDKHQTADDRPFGGGPGMVMKVEPIAAAHGSLLSKLTGKVHTILTSAKGSLFNQRSAEKYSTEIDHLIIICGHYEGVDERVAEHIADEEVRIGNYVLTGGEPAAAVITDAVCRLIPGVLGNEESNLEESHDSSERTGVPQYTRPENFQGWTVPQVLLQGNHKEIEAWREAQRKKVTE